MNKKLEGLPAYCQLMKSEKIKSEDLDDDGVKVASNYHQTSDMKTEMFYKPISKMLSIENIKRKIL